MQQSITGSLVKSQSQVFLMNINICLGSLNLGYVLTYLTLSIDTLFSNLGITEKEKTSRLSIINGILPLGCVVGVFIGYFLKKQFTFKQCIHIADAIGLLSLFALIANADVIIAFRFFLGISNGISSLIMPVYVKSLCPQQFYGQASMCIGYGINIGLAIGQLMGLGYIDFNGETSSWWRVVFIFPSIICIIRSAVIHFIYNYDTPDQLIMKGNHEQAKYVLCQIYKIEYVDQEYERYCKQSKVEEERLKIPFFHIFKKQKLVTLQVGIVSMFVQIWCGSFAVFYYSAQIFDDLADGNRTHKTIYTLCLGLFGILAQFSTTIMLPKLGSKYILILGALLMGILNIVIGVLSKHHTPQNQFAIFILLVLLIMLYASTLGPVAWSIVPQINDSDGTFLSMEHRWAFQAALIFSFPYIVQNIHVFGAFLIFAIIDFIYVVYCYFCIVDSRGKTNEEIVKMYQEKYQVIEHKIQPEIQETQQIKQNTDQALIEQTNIATHIQIQN